mmetsp:Transcript_44513/g.96820  ORF Transcript_44513/g.96820 Transcript_44513/m.96820 type:complete len:197 (-) Transcript_44513:88-678(-)
MAGFRSSGTLALPPQRYGTPKGAAWQGVKELQRFLPVYPASDEVFEEYLSNPSMSPNRHAGKLASSTGLLELHYDTMRKRQRERSKASYFINSPTMDRPWTATVGYGGFIPGKESGNIISCTHATGSRLAMELRGKQYKPPMSGITYSLPARSASLPRLAATHGSWKSSTPTHMTLGEPGMPSQLASLATVRPSTK